MLGPRSRGENMDPRTLFYFARVKPLFAWSVSSSILGISIAGYLTNWHLTDLLPLVLSVIGVVLIQYVAHPLNDVMDLDLDRQAPIENTGRIKPIVDGMITVEETKLLSYIVVALILVIASYLIFLQPLLIFPAAFGLGALFAYNSSALRFAYKPYTEVYLSMPVNAIAAFVIAYIGSGQLSSVAIIVSILYGFAASTFFVSMMSMDFPTDKLNGKRTTIVAHPHLRWCTYYPMMGLVLSILSPLVLLSELGLYATIVLSIISIAVFLALVGYGYKVAGVRLQYLAGLVANPEGRSGYIRLRQLYLSIAYAVVLASFFTVLGVILW